jgi:hypothetical protein
VSSNSKHSVRVSDRECNSESRPVAIIRTQPQADSL